MEAVLSSSERRISRRVTGRYYTPRHITRSMLSGCLQPILRARFPGDASPPTILDLSCGEGAFLLEAFDLLEAWYAAAPISGNALVTERTDGSSLSAIERRDIIGRHLFGVDVDAQAVKTLRAALAKRASRRPSPSRGDDRSFGTGIDVELDGVLKRNVRRGDALTGRGIGSDSHGNGGAGRTSHPHPSKSVPVEIGDASSLDWSLAFPQVARRGGFDVIVGNPPYRRELNAKAAFDRVAASPLGRRWRQPRMDLWYYFLHRGLDLLRHGGTLSFITGSYWTSSAGASKLIARLEAETTLEEVVLLGDAPVFPDVSGRHVIFRLRKERSSRGCRVIDLSRDDAPLRDCLARLTESRCGAAAAQILETPSNDSAARSYVLQRRELFSQGRISLRRPDPLLRALADCWPLSEQFEVRQGIAENPPVITSRHRREFGDRYRPGEGVFVVTPEELQRMGVSEFERSYLRPYYDAAAVRRYHVPAEPARYLLYLTRRNAPDLDRCPGIRRHLERFRPILERRRETRQGRLGWWQLHWPREERLFTRPRVLSVQMGRTPRFAFAERPTYVGFSVNLILPRPGTQMGPATLCGILNSSLARRWFEHHAKHRGVRLEINGGTLRQFPLPGSDPALQTGIDHLVRQRQEVGRDIAVGDEPSPAAHELEQRIDTLVNRLYGV